MTTNKRMYLGDGVYAVFEDVDTVLLYTDRQIFPSGDIEQHKIWLGPNEMRALNYFYTKCCNENPSN